MHIYNNINAIIFLYFSTAVKCAAQDLWILQYPWFWTGCSFSCEMTPSTYVEISVSSIMISKQSTCSLFCTLQDQITLKRNLHNLCNVILFYTKSTSKCQYWFQFGWPESCVHWAESKTGLATWEYPQAAPQALRYMERVHTTCAKVKVTLMKVSSFGLSCWNSKAILMW